VSTLADLLIKVGIDPKGVDKGAKGIEGRMEKTWGGLKAGALAGGAAAGAALIQGLSSALDAEVATDKLAAQLGAEGKEAENLGVTAGNLYAKGFGQSMDEVATAVGAVTTSFEDFGSSNVEDLTAKSLNLAKTFELDVTRAAQVAGQAVKSGLAKDGTEALDLLTTSMQLVPAAVREDLVDAIDEYGPFMAGIGITGEKAFGLLVKASEKGMYGIDKTGDALKEFGIRATDMSAASKVGYDALGLSQEEMSRKLLQGGEAGSKAFDQIVGGLLKIKDPVKQSQAALALFGTPLEDLSVHEIPKFLGGLTDAQGGLGDVAGAADKMGKTLNDNAATKLEGFKRVAQAALVEQLAKAIPYIEATFGWLAKNSSWVTPLAVGLGLLAAAIGVMVAVQWAWNAALAVSPVTWIVLAVVALIGVIVYLATKTQFFQTIWAAVWGFMKGVGAWFAGPFAGFFVMLWGKIVGFAKGVWHAISLYFGFWYGLLAKVKGWAGAAVDWIRNKFNAFVAFVGGLPGKVRAKLSSMWDGLKAGFRVAINYVIGKWNSLQFTIPSFSILGKSFGGGTIGTPNIPQLADGGIVKARAGGTLVNVGEGGQDEAVVPLGRGAQGVGRQDPPQVTLVIEGAETEFRRWLNKSIRVKGPVGGTVRASA
jgi:hypothetical protein